jgi:hypothetical protein
MTSNTVLYTVAAVLFGDEGKNKVIHSDFVSRENDRWGVKVEIALLDGSRITGRLSRAHKFNGSITAKDGTIKKYRSFSAI